MIEINQYGYRVHLQDGKMLDEQGREVTRETYVFRPGYTTWDDLLVAIRRIPLERLEAEGFLEYPS